MSYHPEQQLHEKPAGTFPEGRGDRRLPPYRCGDKWFAVHIRDDGSATEFVWP